MFCITHRPGLPPPMVLAPKHSLMRPGLGAQYIGMLQCLQ
jgi:hypothetical protein